MKHQKQLQEHLRTASRHVAGAEQRLIAQHARVRELAAVCDKRTVPLLKSAAKLLRTFEQTVKVMRGHLEVEKGLAKRSQHR